MFVEASVGKLRHFASADAAEFAQAGNPKGWNMNEKERMLKLLAASPATLAAVDAVLTGTDKKKADDDCRLVTFVEAAKRLNLSRPTIYRLVKNRRLESVALDGTRRIRLKSLVAFADGTAA